MPEKVPELGLQLWDILLWRKKKTVLFLLEDWVSDLRERIVEIVASHLKAST